MGNFVELKINTVAAQPEQQQQLQATLDPRSGGYGKMTFADGKATEVGVTKVNMGSLNRGEGILATAKTPYGSPTGDIKDDTILTIQGLQVQASIAAKLGLIHKDRSGRYL